MRSIPFRSADHIDPVVLDDDFAAKDVESFQRLASFLFGDADYPGPGRAPHPGDGSRVFLVAVPLTLAGKELAAALHDLLAPADVPADHREFWPEFGIHLPHFHLLDIRR